MNPEIYNDELYFKIIDLVKEYKPKTILEIGSAEGRGSTQAFIAGALALDEKPTIFCIECNKDRYEVLCGNTHLYDFVVCKKTSSVITDRFMSLKDMVRLYCDTPELKTRQYPLSQVIGWYEDIVQEIKYTNVNDNGIKIIRYENQINCFDMVLIDGSPFSGMAEYEDVYGAKIIILDDIIDIKNWEVYMLLKKYDSGYKMIACNEELRNGYVVFEKVVL